MKRFLLFLLITFQMWMLGAVAQAQVPQGIPYQAAARNASGQPLVNTAVKVRFSIMDSVATGITVYQETHSVTTNNVGLFNVNVGLGTPVTGTFSGISWGQNFKFMKVELDPSGAGSNYVDMGTQQMMSVPYSLYSATSGAVQGGGVSNGSGINLNSTIHKVGFSSNGTWTCPIGVTQIMVELWGAGGGGGGCNGAIYPRIRVEGGGGGSGGYIKQSLNVVPGQVYQISIGIGGNGGGQMLYGQAGGSTSFDTLLFAQGGAGGPSVYNCDNACLNTSYPPVSGTVVNCDYVNNYAFVSTRNYIPTGYITNEPSCAASGGAGTSCGNCGCSGPVGSGSGDPWSGGLKGENGFCIITYQK